MSQSSLQADRDKYNSGYYKEKLEQGLQYQDVVTNELYKRGIIVVGYASKQYQNICGENLLGAEIKRDGRFRETGNIYIEIAEKSHPDKEAFVDSGIKRQDNSWLFVIGDEKTIYIFSTKYLQMLCPRYLCVEGNTSKGYLMPVEDAEKYCIRKIDLEVESENQL